MEAYITNSVFPTIEGDYVLQKLLLKAYLLIPLLRSGLILQGRS